MRFEANMPRGAKRKVETYGGYGAHARLVVDVASLGAVGLYVESQTAFDI